MTVTVGSRTFANATDLEALVVHAADQYEEHGYAEDFEGVEISDPDYDDLYRKLKEIKPKSKAFEGTTPAKKKKIKGGVVVHNPPMTSIAKADGEKRLDIYTKWVEGTTTSTALGLHKPGVPLFADEFKHDGVAVAVYYENGKLVRAGLRPKDGINGTDVTRHMPHVTGVPQTLPHPFTLCLRGELECLISDFEQINKSQEEAGEDLFKNPRNYVAGQMGRDDPEETKNGRIRVMFHGITGFSGAGALNEHNNWQNYYRTTIERSEWANKKIGLDLKGHFVKARPHHSDNLAKMEAEAGSLDYYTDGVVIKVNDLGEYQDCGNTGDDPTNPPRGAIAWKFVEQAAEAVVDRLEWNASRTGRIVPKAIFRDSVNLADTEVSQATANNYGWALDRGLGKGARVRVIKAGKIIPKVVEVIGDPLPDYEFRSTVPKFCPTCKSDLKVVEAKSGARDLMCHNAECAAKHIKRFVFFLATTGAKGVGGAAMKKIVEAGLVSDLSELYELDDDQLEKQCGFTHRQAMLILAAIWHLDPDLDNQKLYAAHSRAMNFKQKIEGWRFFQALGVPGNGESAGKALFKHYGDFAAIRKAKPEELQKVSGIGKIGAQQIHDYLNANHYPIDRLLDRFELEVPKAGGSLTGKNFCLTGSFTAGKNHWKERIEAVGGNVQSSVGSKTDYLVQELGKTDGTPSGKEQQAAKLGKPVISVAQLEAMF